MNRDERIQALHNLIETQEHFLAMTTASYNGMDKSNTTNVTRTEALLARAQQHLDALRALLAAEL